jgi:hypothetical protein
MVSTVGIVFPLKRLSNHSMTRRVMTDLQTVFRAPSWTKLFGCEQGQARMQVAQSAPIIFQKDRDSKRLNV